MATNPVSYGSTAPAAGASSSSGTSSSSSSNAADNPEATKEQFISLLVAQLQNQDPTNPVDGTQFLSQLTEINSLEQLLDIRQDLDQMSGQTAPANATGSSGTGSSSGSSSSGGSGTPASGTSASQNQGTAA
jgi:flagellar basal-body rod modification protein FlgD